MTYTLNVTLFGLGLFAIGYSPQDLPALYLLFVVVSAPVRTRVRLVHTQERQMNQGRMTAPLYTRATQSTQLSGQPGCADANGVFLHPPVAVLPP